MKKNISGKEDEKRPHEYHTEDYGTIYRSTITGLLSDTFGAKTEHKRDGNVLIFDRQVIEKLSKTGKTKIIVKEISNHNGRKSSSYDHDDDNEEKDIECEGVKGVSTSDRGGSTEIEEVDHNETQDQSSLLVNNDVQYKEEREEENNDTPLSDAFTVLTPSHSEPLKGFQLSSKGTIYQITEEQYNSLMRNEQQNQAEDEI